MATETTAVGSSSAAVVAEAARSLHSDPVLKGASRALNGLSPETESAPVSEPEPPSPVVEPSDAPEPERAAGAEAGEADAAGEDYDEENFVEAAPAAEATVAPSGDVPPWKKTWDELKTDDERAKALHEARTQLAARDAKPEASAAAEQAGKAPDAKGAAPQPSDIPDLEAVLTRLSTEDPTVRDALVVLNEKRTKITNLQTEVNKLQEQKASVGNELSEARAYLKRVDAKAQKNPDDLQLQDEIDSTRREVQSLEQRELRLDLDIDRTTRNGWAESNAYQGGVQKIREHAEGVRKSFSEDRQRAGQVVQDRERTEKVWDVVMPKVYEKFGISDLKLQAKAERLLALAADNAVASAGKDVPPEQLEGWLVSMADEMLSDLFEQHRIDTIKNYTDAKKRDANQPAPKGAAAVADSSPTKPFSARDADRMAGQKLRELLPLRR